MERRKTQVIFDLGNGGRLAALICSVATTGSVLGVIVNSTEEILELPSYSYRHPFEGVICLIGSALLIWVGLFGLRLLLGTFVFPREITGRFVGWSMERRSGYHAQTRIMLADRTLSTPRSLALQHALESIPEHTEITITTGAFGYVTQITRLDSGRFGSCGV